MIPLLFLALAASDPPPASTEKGDAPPEQVEKLLQDCGTHRFETAVDYMSDGKPRQTKVKLCGTKGQSDADWVRTLKDAAAKLKANPAMAPEMKTQIIAAINGEIAKLDGNSGLGAMALIRAPGIAPQPQPQLPVPPRAVETRSIEQDYASLPPLPAPKPIAVSAGVIGSLASLPAPRMTIRCSTTDDPLDLDSCRTLRANSLLTIRADEVLSQGTSLRFSRRGDDRGQVQLAQMRPGQSVRVAVPHKLCDGVVRSSVAIEVMRAPPGKSGASQLVDSLGPYDLRC
jgi:hypothetical protein